MPPGSFRALLLVLAAALGLGAQPRPTNVIFLAVDDLGYGDLSCYGNRYHQTPNLDRLAEQGVRFTNAYAPAPVSAASRAAILKAQWPARLGLTHDMPPSERLFAKLTQPMLLRGLPNDVSSVARRARETGYLTAFFGSWGLGDGTKAPKGEGFQLGLGAHKETTHRGMFLPLRELSMFGPRGLYLSDAFAQLTEEFIDFAGSRPFFLWTSFYAVSPPIQGKPDIVRRVTQRQDPYGRDNVAYAAMVEGVDEAVGRIMTKMEQAGIADHTAVFFFSDNGGFEGRAFQGGLRAGRGWLYEGGIRVPLIARWPAGFEGGRVVETPTSLLDIARTALALTGATDVNAETVDGRDLRSLLEADAGAEDEALYWHYPHYSEDGAPPAGAIRHGDLKLIERYEDGAVELYNLADDPGEESNIAELLPEKAAELAAKLAAWRREVGARENQPNADYDPDRVLVKEVLPY